MNEKNLKITKQAHALKGYVSSCTVEILNSFNLELELKYTESAIKSKLVSLLTQLKGFKFVTTLVLVFKKVESKDKRKYDNFYSTQKQKYLSIKITLMMYFNQSLLQLWKTYEIFIKRFKLDC